MSVVTLILSDLVTGRWLGLALICPDARFASIAWVGADHLECRHVPQSHWQALEARISEGLPPEPLPASHEVVRALFDPDQRSERIVQYLSEIPLTEAPAAAAEELDRYLNLLTGGV